MAAYHSGDWFFNDPPFDIPTTSNDEVQVPPFTAPSLDAGPAGLEGYFGEIEHGPVISRAQCPPGAFRNSIHGLPPATTTAFPFRTGYQSEESMQSDPPMSASSQSTVQPSHTWTATTTAYETYPQQSIARINGPSWDAQEPDHYFGASYSPTGLNVLSTTPVDPWPTTDGANIHQPLYQSPAQDPMEFPDDEMSYSALYDLQHSTSETGMATDADDECDTNDKCYAKLLYQCLLEAPNRTRALRDIYDWIAHNSSKARSQSAHGWKNSVRHNLSMNDAFARVRNDNKKTSLWHLTDTAVNQGGVVSTTRFRRKAKNGERRAIGQQSRDKRARSGAKGGRATRDQTRKLKEAQKGTAGATAEAAQRYVHHQAQVPGYISPMSMTTYQSSPQLGHANYFGHNDPGAVPLRQAPSSHPHTPMEGPFTYYDEKYQVRDMNRETIQPDHIFGDPDTIPNTPELTFDDEYSSAGDHWTISTPSPFNGPPHYRPQTAY